MKKTMRTAEPDSFSQAMLITGADAPPATMNGSYEAVRFNAMKHGILSKLAVLAHEDYSEFDDLLAALIDEHRPSGITEQHLIEELATIIWRKRRVLLAEGSTINRSLRSVVNNELNSPIPAAVPFEQGLGGNPSDLKRILRMSPERASENIEDVELLQRSARKSGEILRRSHADAYTKAQRALLPESRDSWDMHVREGTFQADAQGLATFIRDVLEPVLSDLEKQARYQTAIKTQTLGDGLQAHKLEQLNRYETHLDRKFERTLAMLLKMKEIRGR